MGRRAPACGSRVHDEAALLQQGRERGDQFAVAGDDASELLEVGKGRSPPGVGPCRAPCRRPGMVPSVALWWDHYGDAVRSQAIPNGAAVIRFVGHQHAWQAGHCVEQGLELWFSVVLSSQRLNTASLPSRSVRAMSLELSPLAVRPIACARRDSSRGRPRLGRPPRADGF